ncbi:hypothetical protein F2P79_009586 [Pimephales promelas]|nr:hypothetical protein F2P79_009586 [Pimephales promelas]
MDKPGKQPEHQICNIFNDEATSSFQMWVRCGHLEPEKQTKITAVEVSAVLWPGQVTDSLKHSRLLLKRRLSRCSSATASLLFSDDVLLA